MKKRHIFVTAAVVAILAGLILLQIRTWRQFDWDKFATYTSDLNWWRIVSAVVLVYITYAMRALRWKIFLRPVCRARMRSLLPTQYIGFTGLALLGRPGELIRPYLIARKEGLPVSSQIAVWTVERIFDIGAFATLMSIDIFLFGRTLPFHHALEEAAGALLGLVAFMGAVALLIRRNGPDVARWVEQRLSFLSRKLSRSLAHKIRSFGEGLNTIHDLGAFLQLAGVSLVIWFTIALSYVEVLHAYHAHLLHRMELQHVLLLMGASMVGSLLQLPAIGGGSQLATINMMSAPLWFNVPHELATSAGIMLWAVTFMAVIPVGLALSRHEHISIRKVSEESEVEEEEPAPL
ncbi:MAG: lysylphosphatidylglycerol synthase transmembrane domain-containing protein [Terriglobales bacterium]